MTDRKQLIKISTISSFILIVAFLVNYGVNIILARKLGAAIYGDYWAVINTLSLFSSVLLFGIDLAVIKFLPEYIAKEDWHSAAGYMRYNINFLLKIEGSIFVTGLTLALALYLLDRQGVISFSSFHPVFLFLWVIPFVGVTTLISRFLRSINLTMLSLLSFNLLQPLIMFFVFIIMVHFSRSFDVHRAVWVFIITLCFVVSIQSLILNRYLPRQLCSASPDFKENLWLTTGIQLLTINFLSTNLNNMTVIISEIFDHNEGNPGIIAAIFAIINCMWIIYIAISIVIGPLIAPAFANNDTERLQKLANTVNLFMFIGGSMIMLFLFIYGHSILQHFGPGFDKSYVSLVLIAGTFFFTLTFGSSLVLLQYSGHQREIIKTALTFLTLFIVVGSAMTYLYSIQGTVATLAFFQLGITLRYVYLLKKLLGINLF